MEVHFKDIFRTVLVLLLVLGIALAAAAEEEEDEAKRVFSFSLPPPLRNNTCTLASVKGCGECIRIPECAWCKEEGWRGPRCDTKKWLKETPIPSFPPRCSSIEDPPSEVNTISRLPLTTTRPSPSTGRFVQISPQRVRVRVRVNKRARVRFSVAQAKQYPVDLYYLMDLSNSMSDDKDNIVKLGAEIAAAVQNITTDFQIGFGSFVDKEVMPFISLVPGKNCQTDGGCPRPYDFQHQMSLAPDAKLFQRRVKNAPISGNIDNPEGGLDGLVQVLVCGSRIGWRPHTRRVVIFTTDQSFHIALDGKLGGLVRPNDGECHLDERGFYDRSTVLDYPSLGQVNALAQKYRASIIWAVTEDQIGLYGGSVSGLVEGSSAGVISKDSSNIVELVRRQYQMITTTVKATANSSADCRARVTAECPPTAVPGSPGSSGEKNGTSDPAECRNVELGTAVQFTLEVRPKTCRPETVLVQPVGMPDKLLVEVVPLCDCPCLSRDDDLTPDGERCQSAACNGHGHPVCGECRCCGDYRGPNCQCLRRGGGGGGGGDEDGDLEADDLSSGCRPSNASSSFPPCSGRGDCVCGECRCKDLRENGMVISGKYCQEVCDNWSCERDPSTGRLCSGRGECQCGRCLCQEGWKGPDCGCSLDTDACFNPDDSEAVFSPDGRRMPCSGRGVCPCGKCLCTDDRYSGPFCDVCETCASICRELQPCVECFAFGSPVRYDNGSGEAVVTDRCRDACSFKYQERLPSEVPEEWENCTMWLGSCNYTFSYSNYSPGAGPVYVVAHLAAGADPEADPDDPAAPRERLLRCPEEPDALGIILGVVGAVVCLGLLTIFLWKAFTTVSDRREYARFEAERRNVRLPAHENPIFKQATTTVYNPTFNSPKHC